MAIEDVVSAQIVYDKYIAAASKWDDSIHVYQCPALLFALVSSADANKLPIYMVLEVLHW